MPSVLAREHDGRRVDRPAFRRHREAIIHGYDIGSFDEDVATRYIEVKTTNGGAATPFLVSSNELSFSAEAGAAFRLYRIFEFRSAPRLFVLHGDLTSVLALTPINYRARVGSI